MSMLHRFLISLLLIVIFEFSPYSAVDLLAQNLASRDTIEGNKYNLSQFGHEIWTFINNQRNGTAAIGSESDL